MKRLLFTFCTLLLCFPLQIIAQKTLVSGTLQDSLSLENVAYATVHVFKTSDKEKPVAMTVADVDGNFHFEVGNTDDYIAQFSMLGKETVSRKFSLNGEKELTMGTIFTHDDSQNLGEVTVVAQKPLIKMETDKMTYNVENDIDSNTSTVLDILRKVPMVTVDGQDNITVNGSSSFKVYVDGKPNPMLSQYASLAFKQMPASMVKNIEVLTNPGAKYDAEGTGGILNLTMQTIGGQQQKVNSINGQVQLMAAREGAGGGVNVGVQQGKWSFSTRIFGNHVEMDETTMDHNRRQMTEAGVSTMQYNQSGRHQQNFGMANIEMGYQIDTLSSLNASISMMKSKNKDNGHPTTMYSGGIYGDGFNYSNTMKQVIKWTSFEGSIDYQRFFNREHTKYITAIYQIGYQPSETNDWTLFDNEYTLPIDLTSRRSFNHTRTTDHTVQIDYNTPISSNHTLAFGAKYTSRLGKADAKYYTQEADYFILNTAMSMNYRNTNNIVAAYSEYDGKFGKIGTKAGLRYEHTWQDVDFAVGNGENFNKNYGNLVPSATLSYAIAPIVNIGLNYNMRISRPNISQLNPYINRSMPTSISYGNTNLDVEKTHTIRLTFNAFAGKIMLNANLQQRFCNNAIEQYNFYDADILNTTFGNIVKNRNTAFSMFVSYAPIVATRIIFNGEVGYSDIRSDALAAINHGWNANSMLGIQQKLPAKLNFSLYLINRSKRYTLQGWSSGFNMLNATLNRSFMKDRLTVGITGITGLGHGGNFAFDNYSAGSNFTNLQRLRIPVQSIMLNISFSFENLKQQISQTKKKVDSDFIETKPNQDMMNGIGIGL